MSENERAVRYRCPDGIFEETRDVHSAFTVLIMEGSGKLPAIMCACGRPLRIVEEGAPEFWEIEKFTSAARMPIQAIRKGDWILVDRQSGFLATERQEDRLDKLRPRRVAYVQKPTKNTVTLRLDGDDGYSARTVGTIVLVPGS